MIATKFDKTKSIIDAIESLVYMEDISYIEACIAYADKHGLEIEQIAAIVANTDSIKASVEIEAENLNFLKKKARLPI